MRKIYLFLILFCSVNFYANDTITAISTKNLNLRANPNVDSKVISEIALNDTLVITETENGWSKAIYKDSLNGYVKNEFVKEITSEKETIKLLLLKRLLKSYFLIALLFVSAICFGLLYLLKNKLVQLDIIGNFSLIIKSFLIGFIITIIGTLYYFYDLFSFFKIVGIVILLIILYYKISSILKIEKEICESKKEFQSKIEDTSLKEINEKFIEEQILSFQKNIKIEREIMETQLSIQNNNIGEVKKLVNNRLNDLKYQKNNLIAELENSIVEFYGPENSNLLFSGQPFKGLNKVLIPIYIGEPEKVIEFTDSNNNKKENYLYKKLNNYGKNGTWQLNIEIYNGLVNQFQKK